MPRSAATSACSAIRSTASCCGSTPGRRSRSTSTSAPPRRPSSTTAASTSCTTTTAQSFLAALDAKTGKEIWAVKRTDLGGRLDLGMGDAVRVGERRAHRDRDDRPRLRRSATTRSGRELWRLKGMTQATPSPVAADGLLYVGSGSQGEANRPLLAIRPGASGDISLPRASRRTRSSRGCSRASRATRPRRSSIAAACTR